MFKVWDIKQLGIYKGGVGLEPVTSALLLYHG